jgi:hypothetical protein
VVGFQRARVAPFSLTGLGGPVRKRSLKPYLGSESEKGVESLRLLGKDFLGAKKKEGERKRESDPA